MVAGTSNQYESRSSPTNPTSDSFGHQQTLSGEFKPRRKSESYSHSPRSQASLSATDYQYLPYVHHAPHFNYYSEQLSLPWQNYEQFQTAPYFQLHAATLDKKVVLYKTEMCRTFEETGTCKYGVKCQFAHDLSEIRSVPRHPRYKTEICKTFWQLGNCPYGKRCCFIHTENELRDKASSSHKPEYAKPNDVFGSVDNLLIDEISTEAINSRNSSRSSSPNMNNSAASMRINYRRKSIIEDRIVGNSPTTQTEDTELSSKDPAIDLTNVNQPFQLFWSNSDSTVHSETGEADHQTTPSSKYVLYSKSPGTRAVPISKSDIWSANYGNAPFLIPTSTQNSESEHAEQVSGSGSSSRSSTSRQHLLMEMINLLDSQ